MMSKSQITTPNPEWLQNLHAGDLLWSEFMEPLQLDIADLASAISVEPIRLRSIIDGTERVNGELDLRLTRYFRLSEGFFLRLQNSYEIREAKRILNGDLERITPRAA